MSRPDARAVHGDHLDEANRVRALQRHEDDVRRHERERAYRRMIPLLPFDPYAPPVEDMPGCFE